MTSRSVRPLAEAWSEAKATRSSRQKSGGTSSGQPGDEGVTPPADPLVRGGGSPFTPSLPPLSGASLPATLGSGGGVRPRRGTEERAFPAPGQLLTPPTGRPRAVGFVSLEQRGF